MLVESVRQRQQTPSARERIHAAALDLMARRGVDGTTTQELARRAGCSQAAIYKYWPGKVELAQSLYEAAQERLTEAMLVAKGSGAGRAPRALGALVGLLEFARERPEEFAFLFQVYHSDYVRWSVAHRKPRDLVLEEIRAAVAAGEIPAGGGPGTKAALLLGMAIRLAFLERQGLVDGSREEVRATLVQGAAAVLES